MVNIGDCDSDSQSESKLPTEMSEIRHVIDVKTNYDLKWILILVLNFVVKYLEI